MIDLETEYKELIDGFSLSLKLLKEIDEKAYINFIKYTQLIESDGKRFSKLKEELRTEFFLMERTKILGRPQRIKIKKPFATEQCVISYSPANNYSLNMCFELITPIVILQNVYMLHSVSPRELKKGSSILFFEIDKNFDKNTTAIHYSAKMVDDEIVITADYDKNHTKKVVNTIKICDLLNQSSGREIIYN